MSNLKERLELEEKKDNQLLRTNSLPTKVEHEETQACEGNSEVTESEKRQ